MLTSRDRRRSRFSLALALLLGAALLPFPARAQSGKPAPGEMRWALHVTLAARWLDPAETEAFSTPFMVMYAVHDAMLKPMPAGLITPSLAESWTEASRTPPATACTLTDRFPRWTISTRGRR